MHRVTYNAISKPYAVLVVLTTLLLITEMGEVDGANSISKSELKITCWNSRGLVAAIPYLNKLLETNDIVALSEHWLQENRLNVLLEISD